MSAYRKDEYNWRYDSDELPDDVIQASSALENLQLDRKARNLTSSWRFVLMQFWCCSFVTTHKAFLYYILSPSQWLVLMEFKALTIISFWFFVAADTLGMESVRMMAGLITCRDRYCLHNRSLPLYFIVYSEFSAFRDDWMSLILCKIIYLDMI